MTGSPVRSDRTMSWEEHYQTLAHPVLLTRLLQEAVPVLAHVDWAVVETAEGFARTRLPLNAQSTNQHGTHQAALIALAADYTGGIALATVLRGVPVLGVHPDAARDHGAALWLAGLQITYRAPSVGDLAVSAQVPEERWEAIRRRYERGDHGLIELSVSFSSEAEEIATATLTYYVRQSRALKPRAAGDRLSPLYRNRLKASARLIAGLRARGSDGPDGMVVDPISERAAGPQGRLLADRFSRLLPPLRTMVARRTAHIDALLDACLAGGLRQLVLVGAGLDFRASRLVGQHATLRVFEIDLPEMLAERERVLREFDLPSAAIRTQVVANLEFDDVASAVVSAGFDPTLPSLVLYEGMSMYFPEALNRRILGSLAGLLSHPDSRLWLDAVTASVIRGASGDAEAVAFLEGMARLGEPFIFGLEEAATFLGGSGLAVLSDTPCADEGRQLFQLYRFYVLTQRNRPPSIEKAS